MELLQLGDDEMLRVLSYLSPEELMGCRVVCRRWRSLALHPLLWRNKSLFASYRGSSALVGAALRLVPCLKYLSLGHKSFEECDFLLSSTCCAVSELSIDAFSSKEASLVAVVLARQESLGRLKKVSFRCSDGEKEVSSMTRFRTFLQQLLRTAGLESIDLSADFDVAMPPLLKAAELAEDDARVPASLRELDYDDTCGSFPDPYLPLRLEWHATTLEVVKINQDVPGSLLGSLLGAMPRLRELRCPLLQDMAPIVQCRSLKRLHLHVDVDDDTRLHIPGAGVFLRSAVTHLEHLELTYGRGEERADAVNLVLSIGGSGKDVAALRSLKFPRLEYEWTPPELLLPLAAILPRLPHLTVLDLDKTPASEDFLSALDGQVLPELVELRMATPGGDDYCQHEFAHSDSIYDVLMAYPRLHVKVKDLFYSCPHPDADCDFCKENTCHTNTDCQNTVIFSHPVETPCEVDHTRYDSCLFSERCYSMRIVEQFVSSP